MYELLLQQLIGSIKLLEESGINVRSLGDYEKEILEPNTILSSYLSFINNIIINAEREVLKSTTYELKVRILIMVSSIMVAIKATAEYKAKYTGGTK